LNCEEFARDEQKVAPRQRIGARQDAGRGDVFAKAFGEFQAEVGLKVGFELFQFLSLAVHTEGFIRQKERDDKNLFRRIERGYGVEPPEVVHADRCARGCQQGEA
jgi:hypothetical protein